MKYCNAGHFCWNPTSQGLLSHHAPVTDNARKHTHTHTHTHLVWMACAYGGAQLLFLSGVSLILGFDRTKNLFFKPEKLRGSALFFAGARACS